MNNYFAAGLGFALGSAIGTGVTYILVKRYYELKAQEAIDEMKAYYKDKEKEKEPEKNVETKKEEQEDVRIDKPSITEISSILNSNNDNNSVRTNYATLGTVKAAIKELEEDKTKEKKSVLASVDSTMYDNILEASEIDYDEEEYTFDTDTETWVDYWNTAIDDISTLPFDPKDVVWDEDDRAYFIDEESHLAYLLRKE